MKMSKSLYDISWKVTEEEYRLDLAYSYSTISKYNREGFNNLSKLFDKIDSPSLVFGNLVDTLITDKDNFDKKYLIAEFPSISDSIINIVNDLFYVYKERYNNINNIPDNNILEKIIFHNYQNNWLAKTKVESIKKKGEEYYNLLYLSTDKSIINQVDYKDALNCVNTLKNSEITKDYFSPNNPFNSNIEKFYQLKFKGEYEEISLRCMSDLLIVNHDTKTITPCDLKTSSGKEWDFYKSFIKWGYWIQAQLYWEIIRQNLDKDEVYKEYTLEDYKFIVISRSNLKPLIWDYYDTRTKPDCYYGTNNQYFCRNWRSIVKELNYYLTKLPEYPLQIKNINSIIYWLNEE